jgi:hypothetical protein
MEEVRNEARLRIGAAPNPGDFLVQLWNQSFPAGGTPSLASGTFTLASLDATTPTRQEILDAVRRQTNPDALFLEAGKKLFGLLQRAEVDQAWLALLEQNTRTYLELDAGLEELPWELLCQEVGGLVDRYFARPGAPVFRTHLNAEKALPMEPTLRVLIVTGEPVGDTKTFPGNQVRAIRKRFAACEHSVHLEVIEQPALQDLAAMLDELRPHVFFFVGHGGHSPHTNRPALVFGPQGPNRLWWDSDDIYQQFSNQNWAPRLIILNACESTTTSSTMAAVSSAFAKGGALAVIGYQATVTEAHALELVGHLCRHLVENHNLDAALSEIRNSLGRTLNGWSRRDWALPVLSVAVPPQQILPFSLAPAPVRGCTVLGEFQRLIGANPFVDRISGRREITASVRPFGGGRVPAHCVIVEGPEGSGKSWLVKRCERDFASAGMLVRHCELGGLQALDFIGVLERILHGDPSQPNSLVHQPLPATNFADFVARAAEYRGGSQDPASIRRVCAAFRTGLDRVSDPDGLLIVLDQFHRDGGGGIAPEDFQLGLLNDFVIPIANGLCARVRLVLIAHPADRSPYGLDRVVSARIFRLAPFAPAEFPSLFLEFCRFERNEALEGLEQYWRLAHIKNAAWLPRELQRMREVVEAALP